MNTTMILLLSSFLFKASFGQIKMHESSCGGTDIINVGLHLKGFTVQQIIDVKASQLRNGFTLEPADSTYKITSFVIYYDDKKSTLQIPIEGNVANMHNSKFLKTVKQGDQIQIECVKVRKGEIRALSTALWITLTD